MSDADSGLEPLSPPGDLPMLPDRADLLRTEIKAVIDGLDHDGILSGWACVVTSPSQRVRVSIFDAHTPVISGLADLPRPDVGNAGFGDGNSGYSLRLPDRLFDGRAHRFSVVFDVPDAETQTIDVVFDMPLQAHARVMAEICQAGLPVLPTPALIAADIDDDVAAVYAPGQYVVCRQPHTLPVYHTSGWYRPEPDFTWIEGVAGVIRMLIRRPRSSYKLMLDVVPNGVGRRTQTLEVFFNHFRMARFEVPEPDVLTVEIPAELFILRNARVDLLCEEAIASPDPAAVDTRRLGIAVKGWCIA